MCTSTHNTLKGRYLHLKKRIEKALKNGQFYRYTKRKQQQLLQRLQRYHQRLLQKGSIVPPLAGMLVASATLSQAQTFMEVTTTASPFINLLIDPDAPFGLTNVGDKYTPSFLDIDGDGDLDALVGESFGNINYFENTGTITAPAFTLSADTAPFGLTDVGAYSNPSFVDIDGDRDLDAFVGGSNGNINYFENTGDSSTPAFTLRSSDGAFGLIDVGDNSTPTFVDIDGDGDLDAFVGEKDGNINYFENTSTNSSIPAFTLRSSDGAFGLIDVGDNSTPTFVDIDGDGDLDAFVGEGLGNINYFENTGTITAPAFTLSVSAVPFGLTNVGFRSNSSFADIDGDGDLDAFVGVDSYNNIFYFENTSTNSSIPAFIAPVVDVGSRSVPSFVDIDGDGDLDAFVGERVGNINYFENTGTITAPTFTLSTVTEPFGLTDVGEESAPTFVDIDGDGDLDAFVGEEDNNVNYFENTGTITAPAFTLSTDTAPFGLTNVGFSPTPSFVDIDGDGDLDAFMINGSTFYFENTGTITAPAFTLSTDTAPFKLELTRSGSPSAPSFVDVDNDGDFDAFVGVSGGDIYYFENTGDSSNPAFAAPVRNSSGLTNVGNFSTPTFVDIDGDNFFEAIIGNSDGRLTYFESDIIVPVELVFFKASLVGEQVQLQWQTASEIDNEGFFIERSQNGKTWKSLSFVKGAGTTIEVQDYAFVDEAAPTGINYYRLKQIDFGGSYEYSDIEAVQIVEKDAVLNIFPVPTRGTLHYKTEQLDQITAVHLFDLLGKNILSETTFDGILDLSTLPKGQYILTIKGLGQPIYQMVQKQ